jgi:hypothetical protein
MSLDKDASIGEHLLGLFLWGAIAPSAPPKSLVRKRSAHESHESHESNDLPTARAAWDCRRRGPSSGRERVPSSERSPPDVRWFSFGRDT